MLDPDLARGIAGLHVGRRCAGNRAAGREHGNRGERLGLQASGRDPVVDGVDAAFDNEELRPDS